MSASTLNTTTYNTVAANTVDDAVIDAPSILSWRQNVKAVVDQHATEIDAKAAKTQPAWTAPTLLNGWVNSGGANVPAQYLKDELGFVHLRGTIKSGSAAQFTNLFIMPVGYRPSGLLTPVVNSNGAFGTISIYLGGEVQIILGSNVSLFFDVIYRAEN